MDRFEAMRVFVQVVEQRSFTLAAETLNIPRSTASDAVKQLEARLGVRLLQRTTRQVRSTLDGEAYYRRCVAILGEVEEADATFKGGKPRGLLRVDAHGTLARHFIVPGLPAFFAEYPDLRLHLSEGDRFVDLVREGIDCVLRVGELHDSALVARRVGLLDEVTCASSAYLARHGTPASIDALGGHMAIGFMSSATGAALPLEFMVDGKRQTRELPAAITVTAAETYVAAARLGLGLIQVPRYHIEADLSAGTLVEVLPQSPPSPSPVSVLYPHRQQLSPRVRVFIDWVTRQFADDSQTRVAHGM